MPQICALLLLQLTTSHAATKTGGYIPSPDHSIARRWNELLLESIRNDLARPVVHARNLFHVSAAMYDAWSIWDAGTGTQDTSVSVCDTPEERTAFKKCRKERKCKLADGLYDRSCLVKCRADHCVYEETTDTKPSPYLLRAINGTDDDIDLVLQSGPWDRESARHASISHAAYGMMRWRYALSPGFNHMLPQYHDLMAEYNLDPAYNSTIGNDPRAVGNRIANAYIQHYLTDGSQEEIGYSNLHYKPVNLPLFPHEAGTNNCRTPDRWQPLSLRTFIDQSGNSRPYGEYPAFLGPEWGSVTPFSLREDQKSFHYDEAGNEYLTYIDPGPPPMVNLDDNKEATTSREEQLQFLQGFEQVLHWSGHMDPIDDVMVDISPASVGDATIPPMEKVTDNHDYLWFYDALHGGDIGSGYERNPVTGDPYPKQEVPRGDYARILAEFWADGPDSVTPPGHWYTIVNDVIDNIPQSERRVGGEAAPAVDVLEYDIKAYFALGGAMHDAAIAAWGLKGRYDYVRPVTVIRWMAENGQRSDPNLERYHSLGLELIPGLVEMVTVESTKDGERHAHLKDSIGEIAAKCWRGPDYIGDIETENAGVGWILVAEWWPYQRPTFVTPNFAGYVSGHSTFSRTGAELLTLLTGSPYFPGGIGEYVAPANEFLVFENGPSVDVRLQWASYRDASDQCSLSRIWGGIHPGFDDIPGRLLGEVIGPQVWELATDYFSGEMAPMNPDMEQHDTLLAPKAKPEPKICFGDVNRDGRVDNTDFNLIFRKQGTQCVEPCPEDLDGDMFVGNEDISTFFRAYVNSDCEGGLVR